MVKGNRVRVYQKPKTDENLEGIAVLVRREVFEGTDDGMEFWSVRFEGDEEDYGRLVHARNVVVRSNPSKC